MPAIIFIPIPTKANIYRDQLSAEEQNQFGEELLPRLFVELEKRGVAFVDILTPFQSNKEKGLYQLDDTHWGVEAIKITAGQIASMIR